MRFIAGIDIMPHRELPNPQGRTVANIMKNVDIAGIGDVGIGKHTVMNLEADSDTTAHEKVETACKKIQASIIMETYSFSVKAMQQ